MIQESTTTGRPSAAPAPTATSASLPGLRMMEGAWSAYNEEENRVLENYQTNYGESLKAQSTEMLSQADEVNRLLGEFWRGNERYYYWNRRYHKYGDRKYKRRRNEWMWKMRGAFNKAQELENIKYKELPWNPPIPGETPVFSGEAGVTMALRDVAGVQRKATAERPGSIKVDPGAAGSLTLAAKYQKEQEGLQEKRRRTRADLAEQYKPLQEQQQKTYKTLQQEISGAIARARESTF